MTSMTPTMEIIWQLWHKSDMKAEIWHVSLEYIILDGNHGSWRRLRGSYSNLGEEGRWRERPYGIAWEATPIRLGYGLWMYLEPYKTNNVYKIQVLSMRRGFFSFVKLSNLWILRASGWLVFLLKPISRVKDSHPSWCLERPLKSFMEI